MIKSELELLKDANEIIRTFNYIIERKGVNTNWNGLDKKVKNILKEQHRILYPTIKEIRLQKLNKINEQNQK